MSENNKPKLFIIDAYSMIYRAYYAFRNSPIINSKGLNTSAIYGFGNIIIDILKNEKPTHIGVAFDSAEPTFRHIEFVSYKANRESMPEEIAVAIPYIFDFLKKLNIPTFAIPGFEADDIIGTLAKKAEKENFEVYMMTSDKDFSQLVTDNIFVYQPGKFGKAAQIIGPKEVCQKYEIDQPSQLIDILGLWGDASDNIPGVHGIGEIKAKKLIQQFGSIENLIQNANQIENIKLRKVVEDSADAAIFSKRLVTIETAMDIEFKPEELKWELPDPTQVIEFFKELEFRTFSKRFLETFYTDSGNTKKASYGTQTSLFETVNNQSNFEFKSVLNTIQSLKPNYLLVTNMKEFAEMMEDIDNCEHFAFDTETTGLDPMENEIIGISFCMQAGKAYYLPLMKEFLKIEEVLAFLQLIFENEEKLKIAHNFKFDYRMLLKHGIRVKGKCFDTMIAHYLINPEHRHSLDILAETYLDYKTVSFEDILPMKNPGPEEIKKVPVDRMKDYSCEDSDVSFQLFEIFDKQLKDEGMYELFEKIEMPLVFVLADMENEGIKINTEELAIFSLHLNDKLLELEKEIFKISGVEFNLASPKQLGEVLFDKLKISDKPPRTKTKQYATGEEILVKYSKDHEIIPLILEHRSLNKLKSTYVDALPKSINPRTGRIHTFFNQTVTSTGRLSSTNPNLQNIPIRTDLGQEIRKAFIPTSSNSVIMSADYSQIELRIIAAVSLEENMIEAFKNNIDIHQSTASRIYDIPIEEVSSTHRRNAKTVNFGIIYGISAYGLSERMNISKKEADILISEYFKKYPQIKHYMESTIEFAKTHGFVETIMKRKRIIQNINSTNGIIRGSAERTAINAPIQGSAADIIKFAMIKVYNKMKSLKLKSKMLMQIHDELVFNVVNEEIEIMKSLVEEEMKSAFSLNVPIEVDIDYGRNWLEAH